MNCLAVTAKNEILFIHYNILCLIVFLPEYCAQVAEPRKHFLASPRVSCLELLENTFFFCTGFAPEVLPPVRHLQVQIKEEEGEILPKELSLEPGKGYNT